ncbi:recombinase family protein [Halohasta litorea]|uniref:Recombinase family protein n=1 Tax=Halohasta litorea TaxID=869891 RepID=A0ABD6DBQ6_9EURY
MDENSSRRCVPDIYNIAGLLITLFSGVYITCAYTGIDCSSLIYILFTSGIGMIPVGLLSAEEVDGNRVLILVRVSSKSQSDNSSKSTQLEALKKVVEKIDGTVIEILEAEESAAEIERSQLNTALEMARNDEYDILAVYEVDRLSRADPWDTLRYLHDLQQSGITLYCDSYGFIDWDEHYDFEILAREAVFANRWLNRLKKGRVDGVRRALENGEWPFGGEPPVGYYTDTENKLKLDEEYAGFIQDIFHIYLETGNRSETKRQINSKLEQAGLETISYPQVKTILTSQLVLGRREYAGEVMATDSSLEVVDKSLFQEVQTLLSNQSARSESPSKPDFLRAGVERFGADYVMQLIDTFQPFRCRSCDGDMERRSSTDVWGIRMPRYECEDCGYEGGLVNESELKKLHQTFPLRCPYCTATEEFEATELRQAGTKFDYKYTCNLCEYSFGSDMQPDQLRRMLNHPALKFSITGNSEDQNDGEFESDDDQRSIGDFS